MRLPRTWQRAGAGSRDAIPAQRRHLTVRANDGAASAVGSLPRLRGSCRGEGCLRYKQGEEEAVVPSRQLRLADNESLTGQGSSDLMEDRTMPAQARASPAGRAHWRRFWAHDGSRLLGDGEVDVEHGVSRNGDFLPWSAPARERRSHRFGGAGLDATKSNSARAGRTGTISPFNCLRYGVAFRTSVRTKAQEWLMRIRADWPGT